MPCIFPPLNIAIMMLSEIFRHKMLDSKVVKLTTRIFEDIMSVFAAPFDLTALVSNQRNSLCSKQLYVVDLQSWKDYITLMT